MKEPKNSVLDRIEQSFGLLKNNFFALFLSLFLYNIFSVLVFGGIGAYVLFSQIDNITPDGPIFTDPIFIIFIVVGMTLFLVYLLLYIPVFLGLIKTIQQVYNNEAVKIQKNIYYGFSRLWLSMKTYWYIFAYVALIPALIFIVGGIFFNIGLYANIEIIASIGVVFMIASLVLFIVFSVYRGIKSIFALYAAVDSDSFTKDNFLYAVDVAKNQWWRILGNLMLVGFIIGLLSSLISGLFSFISPSIFSDVENIKSIDDIKSMLSSFSMPLYILSSFLSTIVSVIGKVFMIVFIYVFFQRLALEQHDSLQDQEKL